MENFVFILLMSGLVLFILGIVMVILTGRFIMKREHPVLSIVLAVLQVPCIYIPIKFTVGFVVARIVLAVMILYGIAVVVLSFKNMNVK